MSIYKKIYFLIFIIWVVLFFAISINRVLSKYHFYRRLDTIDSPILLNNQSIEDMVTRSNEEVLPKNKVLFISEDGFDFLYYNLLSYPVVAEWSYEYKNELFKNYDFIIVYSPIGLFPQRNGIYRSYDIN